MVNIILNLALIDDKFVSKLKFESGVSSQLERLKHEEDSDKGNSLSKLVKTLHN